MDSQAFFARLDAATELEVRENLAAGRYNQAHAALAHEWLRRKEAEQAAVAASRMEAREEQTISLTAEANRIASQAAASARASARWARWAAIIAILAAIIAAKDQILALIFGNP